MGWNDINPVIEKVVFDDGTIIEIPRIEVGDGGHVYRPPGFPNLANKRHTTFGRGWDAKDKAKRIVGQRYSEKLQVQRGRGAKVVSAAVKEWNVEYGINGSDGPGFHVAQRHPVWGWILLSAALANRSYSKTVSYRFHRHMAALDYVLKAGELYGSVETTDSADREFGTRDEAVTELLKFKDSPLGQGQSVFGNDVAYLMGQDELETNRNWETKFDINAGYFRHYQCTREAQYLTPEALGNLFEKQAKGLEELGRAISVTGATFNIRYHYGYTHRDAENGQKVEEVTIRTPIRPEKNGQQHEHTVIFDERGVSVKCGYIEDEELALEYQKRHILDTIQEISTEPQWEEETIEIGSRET